MIFVPRLSGAWRSGAAAALLLLAGCAGVPQTQSLLRSPPVELDRRVELTAVPFYPQEKFQCGPAALSAMLGWSGVEVTPEELKPRVYIPAREGSLQPELLAAARSYHRVTYVLKPDLTAVLREVHAGHPVLVLQNLAFNWYPRWHYAVVIGYDLDRRELILRSGTTARLALSLRTFEYTWRRSGYWAVVMLPAEDVPATAEEMDYLQAVLSLEQGGDWETAAAAYRAAAARWPASPGAWFGLGNTYYQLNDYAAAEAAFRKVLEVQPDHAPALNNLAYVLLQRGRLDEARRAAERATAIDAGNLDYRATLEEIMRAIPNPAMPAAGESPPGGTR